MSDSSNSAKKKRVDVYAWKILEKSSEIVQEVREYDYILATRRRGGKKKETRERENRPRSPAGLELQAARLSAFVMHGEVFASA